MQRYGPDPRRYRVGVAGAGSKPLLHAPERRLAAHGRNEPRLFRPRDDVVVPKPAGGNAGVWPNRHPDREPGVLPNQSRWLVRVGVQSAPVAVERRFNRVRPEPVRRVVYYLPLGDVW